AELVAVIPAPAAHEPSTIERALSQLGEADRELLCLVAWEELTPTEIAVAMDLPAGTVRVRLHRARARLSKALEALDGVPVKRRTPTGHVEGGTASVAAEEV
ncbi:MAG: sigma-70 family RNA polymerase sigma factor, partial [Propionicimonas sp.]|nr:sigma-70 family RNA polymerase sigma factor [Propionicimonas sp.]